ncbi:MAG: hypothetical protein FWD65_03060 [Coriobacteriia bacterium]|nr:hypothetical protein [Coriobacteriia bacterium]
MNKTSKTVLFLGMLLASVLILAACGHKPDKVTMNSTTSTPTSSTASPNTSDTANSSGGNGSAGKKIPIASLAMLTNEITGKGVISFGDSVQKVKQTLVKYQPSEGFSTIVQDLKTQQGEEFIYGPAGYYFNKEGKLVGYDVGSCGDPVVTSKGLRIGDPISKAVSLYGENYTYNSGGQDEQASYSFTLENTNLSITVRNGSLTDDRTGFVDEVAVGLR